MLSPTGGARRRSARPPRLSVRDRLKPPRTPALEPGYTFMDSANWRSTPPARRTTSCWSSTTAMPVTPKVLDSAMYLGRALQFAGDFDAAYLHIRNATTEPPTSSAATAGVWRTAVGCVPLEIERGDLKPRSPALAGRSRSTSNSRNQHAGSLSPVRLLGQALLVSRAAVRRPNVSRRRFDCRWRQNPRRASCIRAPARVALATWAL